jgi:hypothetical protein
MLELQIEVSHGTYLLEKACGPPHTIGDFGLLSLAPYFIQG